MAFTSKVVMHLTEGPDNGHSTGEAKLEKMEKRRRKKQHQVGLKGVLYRCATTSAPLRGGTSLLIFKKLQLAVLLEAKQT